MKQIYKYELDLTNFFYKIELNIFLKSLKILNILYRKYLIKDHYVKIKELNFEDDFLRKELNNYLK